jgi:Leucine-rich repeat (LRR) protein
MKWAILHEKDYNCLITVIKTLVELNTHESKKILLKEVKKIKDNKYLDENKKIENRKFKKAIKELLADNKFKNLKHEFLADILINYLTISKLTNIFYSVYFELDTYFVTKLDLADVEYEVRGWKSDFKNNIKNVSEIIGLENLTHLTHLNLSNNQIKSIEDLIKLKNLTHLYVSNNQIKNIINLDYIKKIPHLKYIDLAGNQISDYLTSESLINIETNLKKYYH